MWRTFWSSPSREIPPTFDLNSEKISNSKTEVEQSPEDLSDYTTMFERLKAQFDISRFKGLFDRNIFIKPEKRVVIFNPENLKLLSTEPITLPFMYNGYIQAANGAIIAQVNWDGKTYFVKEGEKFNGYKVIAIQRKRLTVEEKEGQLILEFKKPGKGKELVAKLYNELDERIYEVRKDEEINSYKILDIAADSVVLWGENKEWLIKKGR